jgi:hypothetical protein
VHSLTATPDQAMKKTFSDRIYIEGLQTVGQNAENEPNPVALPDPYSNTLSGKRPEVHVEPPVAASNTLTRI